MLFAGYYQHVRSTAKRMIYNGKSETTILFFGNIWIVVKYTKNIEIINKPKNV